MKFITGNSFKDICDYSFDKRGLIKNKNINNYITKFFVKSDYINQFFKQKVPDENFILITHNSDYAITEKYKNYLEYKNLKTWYAQNVDYKHEKLIPIPIGIANSMWHHGNAQTLQYIIEKNNKKQQLMYANFNTLTNPKQREYCLQYVKPKYIENNVSFETYLTNLSKSYFSVCPLGNGIDSHRIWESLYLKTIPIVENTYNINYLIQKYNLPIITIDDWSQLSNLELNTKIYHDIIINFDLNLLTVERCINER